MGVDVTHIIRHNFKDVKNHKAAKKYLLQTLELLKEKFCINLDSKDERFEIRCEDIDDMCFRLPNYYFDFYLRDGFWQIESNVHYIQIVWPINNVYWLRDMIYDIARALGQNEAWHATEYYTWNCCFCEMETCNFDKWLKAAKKQYKKPISEFIPGVVDIEDYAPIYHDTFIGCDERFNELQNRITDYKLIGISRIYKNYVQCEKEGYAYLIDKDTIKPMSEEPIDAICKVFNQIELIYKLK